MLNFAPFNPPPFGHPLKRGKSGGKMIENKK